MGATLADAAYAAGFFDGEGSVYLARRGATRKTPTLLVCIGNTNLEVLEWHKARWGGSICPRRIVKERHRPQWQWVLAPRMASVFLKDVLPYLQIKRGVAQLGLQISVEMGRPAKERIDYSGVVKRGHRYYSAPRIRPEFKERVEDLAQQLSALNARGFNAMRAAA